MAKWFEILGVERGGQPPPALLFKFPADSVTREEAEAAAAELRRQGASHVSVEEVEE